jgi:hypothetical protein
MRLVLDSSYIIICSDMRYKGLWWYWLSKWKLQIPFNPIGDLKDILRCFCRHVFEIRSTRHLWRTVLVHSNLDPTGTVSSSSRLNRIPIPSDTTWDTATERNFLRRLTFILSVICLLGTTIFSTAAPCHSHQRNNHYFFFCARLRPPNKEPRPSKQAASEASLYASAYAHQVPSLDATASDISTSALHQCSPTCTTIFTNGGRPSATTVPDAECECRRRPAV